MFKIVPDPPRDQAKDRAAFNRALDHYLPTCCTAPRPPRSTAANSCKAPSVRKSSPYGTCWKSPKPWSTAR